MTINRDFWLSGVIDPAALLQHEILHLVCQHPARRRIYGRHGARFANYCEDVAINQLIDVPDTVTYKGQTVEFATLNNARKVVPLLEANRPVEYYINALAQHADGLQGETVDDHGDWEDGADGEGRAAEVRKLVDDARRSTEAAKDSIKPYLRQFIESLFHTEIDWAREMRHFAEANEVLSTEPSRSRRNRRYGLAVPGHRMLKKRRVVIGFDVSGSMSDEMVAQVAEVCLEIHKAGAELTVIYFDHQIEQIVEGWGPRERSLERPGNGGTLFQPVFEEAARRRADALIMLTDGCCAEDGLERPRFPVLWGLVEGGRRPVDWGKELPLKLRET